MTRTAMLLSVALLLSLAAPSAWATDDGPPNILIIMADDLGYGDLSSYGADDMETPHIDRLVEQGMRFDRFYANCPVCAPTRAALLTGRYPDTVGVPGVIRTHPRNNWGYLSQQAVLLPEPLNEAGYHTGIVGKWHLGLRKENNPVNRGFDVFHGFLGDMMDDYYTHRRHGNNYMRRNTKKIDPDGHATTLFTDWATDYIRKWAKDDRPFFLYLAYNAPHTPIQPPKEVLKKVKAREEGISDKRAKLVALIEDMDDGVGKVIEALKATGAYENTLTIFTSDNGGNVGTGADNGPLRGGKQDMYEGGIRVPTCAVWPGHIEPGSRTDRLAMTMDLYPTVLDAVGTSVDHPLNGKSLLPTLLGKEPPAEPRTLYWVRREGGTRYMGQPVYAIRRGKWKLLQNSVRGGFELYNLKKDPKEQNDLSKKKRGKYNELARRLRSRIQEAGEVPWQKPD